MIIINAREQIQNARMYLVLYTCIQKFIFLYFYFNVTDSPLALATRYELVHTLLYCISTKSTIKLHLNTPEYFHQSLKLLK